MARFYPPEISNRVKELWIDLLNDPKEKEVPKLPSDDNLLEILEVVYHASFLTEEDKKIQFCVSYNDKNDSNLVNEYNYYNIIEFTKVRTFNINELVKLASATDFENTIIGIKSEKNEIYIWGLINIGNSWSSHPFGTYEKATLPPNLLTITAYEPGTLEVSRSGSSILRLFNGNIEYPTKNCFSEGPIKEFLEKAFEELCENYFFELDEMNILSDRKKEIEAIDFIEDEIEYSDAEKEQDFIEYLSELEWTLWGSYIRFIKGLLNTINKTRQGGSLIILDNNQCENQLETLKIKYACHFDSISDIILRREILEYQVFNISQKFLNREIILKEQYIEYEKMRKDIEDYDRKYKDLQDMISSFSKVDGTIIMDNKLNVLGFGAVVDKGSEISEVHISDSALGNIVSSISTESYGTRHRSMFKFCAKQKNALAFIISKDGGIKAVTQVNDKVVLWKSIDLGTWT